MANALSFISLLDFSSDELMTILDRADVLSEKWDTGQMPQSLKGKQIGLWFYGNGFRNRLAFEIGAKAMGGFVSYVPGDLGIQEPLEDIGSYLSNWYSLMIVRCRNHADLLYLTATTTIPVINARTNLGHPCEVMSDLQFVRRHRGSLDGMNVIFVGEVTNLAMSWFEASNRFPIRVTQVAPPEYLAGEKLLERIRRGAVGEISTSNDLNLSIKDADLAYTDCWPSSGDKETSESIRKDFLPYQITRDVLAHLRRDAVFLPCPPVTRGQEVSTEAMLSPLCMNAQAKKCLLHCQNAIMERCVRG